MLLSTDSEYALGLYRVTDISCKKTRISSCSTNLETEEVSPEIRYFYHKNNSTDHVLLLALKIIRKILHKERLSTIDSLRKMYFLHDGKIM